MKRRNFIAMTAAATGGLVLNRSAVASQSIETVLETKHNFKLKYAPHFGMFINHAGKNPIDELKFMADVGFTALEDNGMRGRPKELQNKIAAEMERLGMTMGVFVAHADFGIKSFVLDDPEVRSMLKKEMFDSVETAKRINAKWCTVVIGQYEPRLDWDYQTANVIDNLKFCAEILEPSGLVMVLEPLNKRDHPGLFLTKIAQAYQICKAVNSPSCKILDDIYHQQITEGNLIPNIDAAWEQIAYFQVGDNPGRKEPTTGEINYLNIFRHIHKKGFDGIVGMEHGKSIKGKEGERALIEAYVDCDTF